MAGQTVDLGIKKRQPFVLAEHDFCVIRAANSSTRMATGLLRLG
jgi:hypothetical protein